MASSVKFSIMLLQLLQLLNVLTPAAAQSSSFATYPAVYGTKRYNRRSALPIIESSSRMLPLSSGAALPVAVADDPMLDDYMSYVDMSGAADDPAAAAAALDVVGVADRAASPDYYGLPTYTGEYNPQPYYYAQAPTYTFYDDDVESSARGGGGAAAVGRRPVTNPLDDLHEQMLHENPMRRERMRQQRQRQQRQRIAQQQQQQQQHGHEVQQMAAEYGGDVDPQTSRAFFRNLMAYNAAQAQAQAHGQLVETEQQQQLAAAVEPGMYGVPYETPEDYEAIQAYNRRQQELQQLQRMQAEAAAANGVYYAAPQSAATGDEQRFAEAPEPVNTDAEVQALQSLVKTPKTDGNGNQQRKGNGGRGNKGTKGDRERGAKKPKGNRNNANNANKQGKQQQRKVKAPAGGAERPQQQQQQQLKQRKKEQRRLQRQERRRQQEEQAAAEALVEQLAAEEQRLRYEQLAVHQAEERRQQAELEREQMMREQLFLEQQQLQLQQQQQLQQHKQHGQMMPAVIRVAAAGEPISYDGTYHTEPQYDDTWSSWDRKRSVGSNVYLPAERYSDYNDYDVVANDEPDVDRLLNIETLLQNSRYGPIYNTEPLLIRPKVPQIPTAPTATTTISPPSESTSSATPAEIIAEAATPPTPSSSASAMTANKIGSGQKEVMLPRPATPVRQHQFAAPLMQLLAAEERQQQAQQANKANSFAAAATTAVDEAAMSIDANANDDDDENGDDRPRSDVDEEQQQQQSDRAVYDTIRQLIRMEQQLDEETNKVKRGALVSNEESLEHELQNLKQAQTSA